MALSSTGALALALALALTVLASPSPSRATSTSTSSTDEFQYLDNGVVKLGVDLTRGGSIGFFGPSGSDSNLINCHDMGREVQLSFYAGPSFYNPDGKCDSLFMGQEWPWNPIGAGDIMGNHGDVTTADFDDSSAHIVTTPLQWACDNVACECEFEQRITLGGPADTGARVDATLHNHRSDTTEYSARRQELPAVYTNGPYYRLFTTEGGELKEYDAGWDSSNSFPWVPGAFTADEHWAALVDENGWGMGVVNLDTTDFIGGFSGEKGQGGSYDAPTGYISPVKTLSLPANTTFEYTFYLVLGDVGTIRAYAQQIVATAAASAAAASPSAASHPQTPLTPFESAGGESDPFDKVDYLSCYDAECTSCQTGFFPTNACLQTATYGEYLYASCSDDGTQLFESFCADSACKTTMKNTTHPTEECFANGDTGMYVKYSCGNE